MAEKARINVDKLSNQNYQVWKFKLELLLIKEDLWDVITEAKPEVPTSQWLKKDGKARATIGLLVEDNQLVHIRKKATAKEAWETLRAYHEKSTLTNKVYILKRICSMKLSEHGDMEGHINLMLTAIEELAALGETLQEPLTVAMMLCSLPESYSTLITALETRPEADLTLELVKSKLIDEYKRRKEASVTDEHVDNVTTALKMRYAKEPERKKNPGVCFYCEKPGHFKRYCRKLKADRRKEAENKKHTANKICTNDTKSDDNIDRDRNYVCYRAGETTDPKCWYVDSGATCHMSSDKEFFTSLNTDVRDKVYLADSNSMIAKGIGIGKLECEDGNGNYRTIHFKDVLFIPELDGSLLSVRKLTKAGLEVKFQGNQCTITNAGKTVATAKSDGHLYKLNSPHNALKTTSRTEAVKSRTEAESLETWHRRFGHRDPEAVKRLERDNLAEGINILNQKLESTCETCIKGKMARKPFPKESTSRTTQVLELVHTDICGPMQTITPGGKRYILTLIDDYSRYTTVYLLEKKSEAVDRIQDFVQLMQTKFQRKPGIIRSDGGGEYVGTVMKNYLRKQGIEHQVTAPYSPQQNGVAERKNRSLCEMGRCMLLDGNLHNRYWGEAISTACYIQNRLPTRASDTTPYEKWFKTTANVKHMRRFGCTAYVLTPAEKRKKLDDKAEKLIFVGYQEGTKGYRLLNTATNRVVISRDVIFLEEQHTTNESGYNCEEQNTEENSQTHTEILLGGAKTNPQDDDHNQTDGTEPNVTEPEPRRSTRMNKGVPPDRYACKALFTERQEPKTRNEAISGPERVEWTTAMEEEMTSLEENHTWDLTELPPGRKAVGSKWTFKYKLDSEGNTCRHKARLVAQGFSQKFGDEYDEIFAPVVKQATLRTLLTIAGKRRMAVRHFDVKTAFLHGDLQETVYMKQPEGFEKPGEEDLVCQLRKSIYGLKQSARAWNHKINDTLIADGFRRGIADPCLYAKQEGNEWVYLLIFVDDIIIASTNGDLIDATAASLGQKFEISDLGNLSYYLGIQFEKDEEGHYLMCQSSYIEKILKRFGQEEAKTSEIPMDPGYIKIKDNTEVINPLPDNDLYRKAIGALLYVAVNTRPDIAAAVSILSRKVTKPTQQDWTEVKRVLRYLKGTKTMKLALGRKNCSHQGRLVGYADADWAGDTEDRKSTSGYIFMYNGGTICWASRKQTCVTLSSTEAEYVALSEACREAKWLIQLLTDLNEMTKTPQSLWKNQCCLKLLDADRVNQRTKHIDVRFHYAREVKSNGYVEFHYCPTDRMTADMLTKPLQAVKAVKLREQAGLRLSRDGSKH